MARADKRDRLKLFRLVKKKKKPVVIKTDDTQKPKKNYQDLIKFNGERKCNGLHMVMLAKVTSMIGLVFETVFFVSYLGH